MDLSKLSDDHIARTVKDIAIRPYGEPLYQNEIDILMEASKRLLEKGSTNV